jgi:hypothetical protein
MRRLRVANNGHIGCRDGGRSRSGRFPVFVDAPMIRSRRSVAPAQMNISVRAISMADGPQPGYLGRPHSLAPSGGSTQSGSNAALWRMCSAPFFGPAEVRKLTPVMTGCSRINGRRVGVTGRGAAGPLAASLFAAPPPFHCRVDDPVVLSFKSVPLKVLTIATMSPSCVS